jgi:hypothetical protein
VENASDPFFTQVENASDPFFKSRRQDEIPTPQFKLRYV